MHSKQEVDKWLQVAKENMILLLKESNYKIQEEYNTKATSRGAYIVHCDKCRLGEACDGFIVALHKKYRDDVLLAHVIIYINHDGVQVSSHTQHESLYEKLSTGDTGVMFSEYACRILNERIVQLNNAKGPSI